MTATLVDAHVHLQPCFDVERFLDAAAANLRHARQRAGLTHTVIGCLLLADDAPYTQYARLRAASGLTRWRIEQADEPTSLRAKGDGEPGASLLIVAARHVVTAERLEVLAVNTRAELADGQAFDATLRQVIDKAGQAIVPWGMGKWLGSRGRRVGRAIDGASDGRLLLGDNAARPRGLPPPTLFRHARRRGIAIVPGSDPLPLPEEVHSVGSYGFILPGQLQPDAPGRDLARRLQRLTPQPRTFGQRKTLLATTRCQLRLRMARPAKAANP